MSLSCTTHIHYLFTWNPNLELGWKKGVHSVKVQKKGLPSAVEILYTHTRSITNSWFPSKHMYKLQMHKPMPRWGEKHAQDKDNAEFDTAQLMTQFSLQPQHTNTRPLHRWEGGAWGPVNTEFYQCVTITETPVLNYFECWSTVKSQCSVALKISHFLPAVGWSCSWSGVVQNFLNIFISSPLGCLSDRCTVPKSPPSRLCIFLFISLLVQRKTLGMKW